MHAFLLSFRYLIYRSKKKKIIYRKSIGVNILETGDRIGGGAVPLSYHPFLFHVQVVICSGGGTDGALRIIRNGIGIHQQALLDMPGIRGTSIALAKLQSSLSLLFPSSFDALVSCPSLGIWALSQSLNGATSVLCVSFVGQTGFLAINGENVSSTSS